MAGVIDVAAYILRGYGAMTTMRSQKGILRSGTIIVML